MDLSLIKPNEQGWVNARELHKALGVKTQFADWVKKNLNDQKAIKGNDYTRFQSFEKPDPRGYGNRTKNEYFISPFLAEHFALMERNERGRAVRDFFIQCRKATEGMALEIARLRAENAKLKEPKPKKLANGRIMKKIINIVETRDIFGNVTIERVEQRKYVDEMTEQEKRTAEIQHLTRVQEGLSKRIKKEACGESVPPTLRLVKGARKKQRKKAVKPVFKRPLVVQSGE